VRQQPGCRSHGSEEGNGHSDGAREGRARWWERGPTPRFAHRRPPNWVPSQRARAWRAARLRTLRHHPDRFRPRTHHPGRLFVGLVVVFGALVAMTVGAIAIVVNLVRMAAGMGHPGGRPLFFLAAGIVLLLVVSAAVMATARGAFRNVASPMAELMTAAEAVTGGDLSARVPEHARSRLSNVASTFNTMVASLERSDQQRRNLTADVAHELRTPLQIIQGNLEGVLDGVYEPTKDHIEATLEATQQLSRLVEDLRTLSLAESGQLALDLQPIEVEELLQDTLTSLSSLAESAGVELRCESAATESKGPMVSGDPGRLDQVLANLVVNAVRHTPSGGTITLASSPFPAGVEITVSDTGEGIAPDDLPFIFDRFWRGDRARTHHKGTGSGLGLAITRQFVRLHGGTIDVASTLGTGTTFTISLPRASDTDAAA